MTTMLPDPFLALISNIRGAEENRQQTFREAQHLLCLAEEEFSAVAGRALSIFTAEYLRQAMGGHVQELRDMIMLILLARGHPITDIGELAPGQLIARLKTELSEFISEIRNGEDPSEERNSQDAGSCPG